MVVDVNGVGDGADEQLRAPVQVEEELLVDPVDLVAAHEPHHPVTVRP